MKFYSRRVIINFICMGHGWQLIVSARFKWRKRENKQRERRRDKERKRDESQEGKRDREKGKERGERARDGRKTGRANERRTVYLATGSTYRSICAQPPSTQTAYVDTWVPIPPPLSLLPSGAIATVVAAMTMATATVTTTKKPRRMMRWRAVVARGLAHYVPHYARTQGALSARARPGNLVRHSSHNVASSLLFVSGTLASFPLPHGGSRLPICFIVPHKKALNINTSLRTYPEVIRATTCQPNCIEVS